MGQRSKLELLVEQFSEKKKRSSFGLDRSITDSREANAAFLAGQSLEEENISGVLRDIQEDISLLSESQEKIRNDISQRDGGNQFISGLLVMLFGLMLDVKKSTDKCNDIAKRISDNMQYDNSPYSGTTLEEKEQILNELMGDIEDLRNEISSINSRGALGSSPHTLSIDQGVDELNKRIKPFSLSQEDFDSPPLFISQNPELVSNTVRVTRQLGDRYYSLSSEYPFSGSSGGSISPSFKLIDDDTGQEIEAVSGYDSVSVEGDIIKLKSSEEGLPGRELRLRIENPSGADLPRLSVKTKLFPSDIENASNNVDSIKKKVESLNETFGFELWACLLLDLASLLKQTWSKLSARLRSAINVFSIKKNILGRKPFGSIPGIGMDLFRSSPIISEILSSIINPSDALIDSLGLRSSFLNPGTLLGGNSAVCSYNKTKYCDLSQTLSRMIKNLMSDLDRIGFNIGNISLDDLGIDLEGVVNFLNGPFRFLERQMRKIDAFAQRIESDICNFIEKRLRGVPGSVTGISGALMAMIPAISAIMFSSSPSAIGGIGDHESGNRYSDMVERLEKAGYNRAADLLRSGNIVEFLSIEEGYETYEGAMNYEMKKIIEKTSDIGLKSYLIELSPVIEEQMWEKTSGQEFRRSMTKSAQNKEISEALKEGSILSWLKRGLEI